MLVENCEVSGARDSALYIGQSTNGIIRNNEVHDNVAGIEIENSTNCEVYGNHTYNNTAGILAFDLTDLPMQGCTQTHIHDNVTEANNHANFAAPGQIVGGVPVGIGILILAGTSNTEIDHNTINGNNSTGILIVSCYTYNNNMDCTSSTPGYVEWPSQTYVHDNSFDANGAVPDPAFSPLGQPPLSDILWDGDVNPAMMGTTQLCIENNGSATFMDFDSRGGFLDRTTDLGPYQCTFPTIPPVSF